MDAYRLIMVSFVLTPSMAPVAPMLLEILSLGGVVHTTVYDPDPLIERSMKKPNEIVVDDDPLEAASLPTGTEIATCCENLSDYDLFPFPLERRIVTWKKMKTTSTE
jgi:hypothetical protein